MGRIAAIARISLRIHQNGCIPNLITDDYRAGVGFEPGERMRFGSRGWNRTSYLRVMSPTSYQCSTLLRGF